MWRRGGITLYQKGIFHLIRLDHGNAWHGNASVNDEKTVDEKSTVYG